MPVGEQSFHRQVARIDDPATEAGHVSGHRARRLIDGRDPGFTDPFVLMAEDWMPRGAFPMHPHRGIETVTYVIEGAVEHRDSAGNAGVIRAGDAQWMTAGRGIRHAEDAPAGTTAHTLQVWINLPAAQKMTEPRYQDLTGDAMPVRREPGIEIRVFSGGSGGVASPTLNYVPVTMLEGRIAPAAAFTQPLPRTYNAFILVVAGSARIGHSGDWVKAGQLAWLTRAEGDGASDIVIGGYDDGARVLLFAGRPLGEPVVFGGPFVMNTQVEIQQAFADYRSGRL
ncbi:MAG: pirin family protein [Caulobacterales bacterium]|nr:pirin family protein [Caulobacterales bacterium]